MFTFSLLVLLCVVVYAKTDITVIHMDENNRMARIGLGKNEGRWFFRIDLWEVGFRFVSK